MARRHSITLRLTLLFALASTTVLLAVGALTGLVAETHFEEQDLGELRGKLELTRHAIAKVRSTADLAALPQQLDDALVGHPALSVMVIDQNGRPLYATPGAHFPPGLTEKRHTVTSQPPRPVTWGRDGHSYSGITAAVPAGLAGRPLFTVAIAVDIQHRREFMRTFQESLWILFVFGMAVSAVLGWFAAHVGLSPVRRIALVARGISASQLNDRLRLDTVPAELTDLAVSFNDMLSRLEDAFQRLSNFSSDLAHELRAPISNLMTQTQVALSKARSVDEYQEILASNLEEYDRLARMTSDMLFLAKADHGLIVPQRDTVDLASELRQLSEFYEPLAEESGITLSVRGDGKVTGDRLMLRRALSNLLSNALRYTERDRMIVASVTAQSDGSVAVGVENPGPAIPPDHLAHLFDRFYRADPSRTRGSSEVAGLGLAITKSIVDAHRGRISVTSADGTTRFEIVLPGDEPMLLEPPGADRGIHRPESNRA